ncbi:MAG: trypsin-like peptidase domain-containing protein [Phaeodactylibacter sp.]|uniref:trypsin-like peptidase domain-containing protein n=1 Tax=Phaeodactylibacter sp. TaxID=1940289 RepID=UPI0032EF28C1
MKAIIDRYRDSIIQIATPYSTGTGFLLPDRQLVVTNNHIVQDNREVVVRGDRLPKQLATVVYADPRYDLAFLRMQGPFEADTATVTLGDDEALSEGDVVVSIGHPFGLEFSITQGVISNTSREVDRIRYLQHDAALNPGNSGGPLINRDGEVIGVNTLGMEQGDNIGFSLPVRYLKRALADYQSAKPGVKVRCEACDNVVAEQEVENEQYCPHCGAKVYLPSLAEAYEPVGVAESIEELLVEIGQDVRLSRRGPNNWEIIEGSARINITYHEDTGLIMGDAYLCALPQTDIKPIYEFLLRENFETENLSFSIKEQDVVLSLLIFDRYLNLSTGMKLFRHLFERADYYDNVLVEKYGARWRQEE